jgi:hypothetical protein
MRMGRFSAGFGSTAGGLITKHAKQRAFQLYTMEKGGTLISVKRIEGDGKE